jgi:hypothetical protein
MIFIFLFNVNLSGISAVSMGGSCTFFRGGQAPWKIAVSLCVGFDCGKAK